MEKKKTTCKKGPEKKTKKKGKIEEKTFRKDSTQDSSRWFSDNLIQLFVFIFRA